MPRDEVVRAAAGLDAVKAIAILHNTSMPAGGTLAHLKVRACGGVSYMGMGPNTRGTSDVLLSFPGSGPVLVCSFLACWGAGTAQP